MAIASAARVACATYNVHYSRHSDGYDAYDMGDYGVSGKMIWFDHVGPCA